MSTPKDYKETAKLILEWYGSPHKASQCAIDECAGIIAAAKAPYPHRIGTSLLTAEEAKQMLDYVLANTQG